MIDQISPKFGIFFCLACSGIHRSLGVHISFVRSATMDALKTGEVARMSFGGNKPWKDFFNSHSSNKLAGRDFEACTISERYDSEAGEEWKERLTAKVEGREYVPVPRQVLQGRKIAAAAEPTGITPVPSGRSTPLSSLKSAGPPQRSASPGQKVKNEAYFARKGDENASRPDNLAPSQGGKYAGFGSATPSSNGGSSSSSTLPSGDDFQKDPMAALTKGFGWLSSTVSKQAATVNKTYIQPGMKSLQEGDLAAQARATAAHLGTSAQQGVKGLGDQINKFVDPEAAAGSSSVGGSGSGSGSAARKVEPEKKEFWDSFGGEVSGPPKEKKEFWDDFAAVGQQKAAASSAQKPTSIGTSALKTGGMEGGKKVEGEGGWGDW